MGAQPENYCCSRYQTVYFEGWGSVGMNQQYCAASDISGFVWMIDDMGGGMCVGTIWKCVLSSQCDNIENSCTDEPSTRPTLTSPLIGTCPP